MITFKFFSSEILFFNLAVLVFNFLVISFKAKTVCYIIKSFTCLAYIHHNFMNTFFNKKQKFKIRVNIYCHPDSQNEL